MTRDEEQRLIAEAVAEGYPDVDQSCPDPECLRVFKNYHHYVRCDSETCPMKDGKGSLLEQIYEVKP